MLLRSSIASTKKFFHRTLENLKFFFSPGYQRLPKTPPHDHFTFPVIVDANSNNPTYEDLEKFYANFTEQWDSQNQKPKRGSKKKTVMSTPTKQEMQVYDGNFVCASPVVQKMNSMQKREEIDRQNNQRIITHHVGKKQDTTLVSSVHVSEKRNCIVEKKLRELEMLDKGNVDHVMDIEEVLHYYSKLTCPAYLEIVEKFFTEMYSEFFGQASPATPITVKSRLKHRSVRS